MTYGYFISSKSIFPYKIIKKIFNKENYFSLKYKLFEEDNFSKLNYGNEESIEDIKFDKKLILNNFKFDWHKKKISNLKKVADFKINNNKFWFLNQNDKNFLSKIKLEDKISKNGGIKSVFQIENDFFYYIAFTDIEKKCSSARIYRANDLQMLYQFDCLPNFEIVDLNGVGGGWVKYSNSEILLATGTPTGDATHYEINKLAQNPKSFWGKILKIKYLNNKELQIEVFTKGHKNIQGIEKINNKFFFVEHGPRGGDEINEIIYGKNYGWPLQSFGTEYNLKNIKKTFSEIKDFQEPLFSFTPSEAPSAIRQCPKIYLEYYLPFECLAVSTLKGNSIFLIIHNSKKVFFLEKIYLGSRIRNFKIYNNNLYAVTDYDGLIVGEFSKL